jgi:hypothetical protein
LLKRGAPKVLSREKWLDLERIVAIPQAAQRPVLKRKPKKVVPANQAQKRDRHDCAAVGQGQ